MVKQKYPVNRKGSSAVLSTTYLHRDLSTAPWKEGTLSLLNSYELHSIGHPRVNGRYRSGGPFFLQKTEHQVTTAGINNPWYQGVIYPSRVTYEAAELQVPPIAPTLSAIHGEGATLISRALPTAPQASLATLVGEIKREGLPSLVGLATMRERSKLVRDVASRKGVTHKGGARSAGRNAGNEYLNIAFGWAPLLAEVQDLARGVLSFQEELDSYREQGRVHTRRRRSLPPETNTTNFASGQHGSCLPAAARCVGNIVQGGFHTSVVNTWFSGAFRYYVPLRSGQLERFAYYEQQANRLLGTRITPEVLWELAPWSWAVDWFSNASDVLRNISALGADGLAMSYGYVMKSQVNTYGLSVAGVTQGQAYSCRRVTTRSTKVRVPASPYGFTADWSTLSSRQLAVIAALGLTKL